MDRLLVATLNILNLADRWSERLPLLLADMAALQPDLIGLQEVVYPMQQDRLLGAAGEGRYEAVPRLGGASRVRQQPAREGAAGRDRPRAAGPRSRAIRASRAPGAPRRLDARVRGHAPAPPARRARGPRDAGGGAAAVAGRVARARRPDRRRRLQRRSARARLRVHARRRVPLRVRGGERRGARGDLAERPAGRGDGHGRRPRLPRLHLAPRRRRRPRPRASPSTARRPAIRRCTRPTTSGSPPRCGSDERRGRRPDAPARPPRRLAPRAGELARGARARRGLGRHRRRRVRRPAEPRRRPGPAPRRHAGPRPGPRRGRVPTYGRRAARRGDPVPRRGARGACPRTCSSTSSSRATATATRPPTSSAPAAARRRSAP